MNQINWLPRSLRQLRKIDPKDGAKIRAAVTDELSDLNQSRNVKALKDHEYSYRLRVGSFRVFFEYDASIHVVMIEEVRKRNERTY